VSFAFLAAFLAYSICQLHSATFSSAVVLVLCIDYQLTKTIIRVIEILKNLPVSFWRHGLALQQFLSGALLTKYISIGFKQNDAGNEKHRFHYGDL